MTVLTLDLPDRDIDVDAISEACVRFGVRELAAFGSRASGVGVSESSDLDLLYELVPDASLGWEIQDLEDRLSEIFQVRVDLVSKKYLHPRLRDRILAEATVIYAA